MIPPSGNTRLTVLKSLMKLIWCPLAISNRIELNILLSLCFSSKLGNTAVLQILRWISQYSMTRSVSPLPQYKLHALSLRHTIVRMAISAVTSSDSLVTGLFMACLNIACIMSLLSNIRFWSRTLILCKYSTAHICPL